MASTFTLSSPAFEAGSAMPAQYTCDADNMPPPLDIRSAPEGTQSFVLFMEDPDVPRQIKPDGLFLHWVLFNIPAEISSIGPTGSAGVNGLNSAGQEGYIGPCPPKEYEPQEHRYFFRLIAIDCHLGLAAGATRDEIQQAIEGHILGEAHLLGTYKKK